MARNFFNKKFSDYLGEQRALLDIITQFFGATPTPTPTPFASPSPTPTPTASVTASLTPTPSATATPSVTPTRTVTPSVTPSPSQTPFPSPSNSVTPSATPSMTPSTTATPSVTPTRTQTPTPSLTPNASPSPTPTKTPTPTPSTTPNVAEFRFSIDTTITNSDSSNVFSFNLPCNGSGYSATVNWGDGNIENISGTLGNVLHVYSTPGQYQIRISGTFPTIYFNNTLDCIKVTSLDQWGTGQWSTLAHGFDGCLNMTYIATDTPDLSVCTSLAYLFRFNSSNAFNGTLGTWAVSNITDLSYTFAGCYQFVEDVNNWDTANVTLMEGTFQTCLNFNSNLNLWSTTRVTNMSYMFSGAQSFNQPLSTFVTSGVTDFAWMFYKAASFDQPIGNWDTSGIVGPNAMDYMFQGAMIFNQDLTLWCVLPIPSEPSSFRVGSALIDGNMPIWGTCPTTPSPTPSVTPTRTPTPTVTPSLTPTSSVTPTPSITPSITPSLSPSVTPSVTPSPSITPSVSPSITPSITPSISPSITPSVTASPSVTPSVTPSITPSITPSVTVSPTPSLTPTPSASPAVVFAGFEFTVNTANAGSASNTFILPCEGSGYNATVDWGDTNTELVSGTPGNVTHVYGAPGIYTIKISGTFPRIYFNGGGDRQKITDIAQWGNIAWTNMEGSFYGCSNLDITATDTPILTGVTDMRNMFRECTSLVYNSSIGSWNMSNALYINSMFRDMNFNQNLGAWDISSVQNMEFMFHGNTTFNNGGSASIANWNTSSVTGGGMGYLFKGASAFNQPLSGWTINVSSLDSVFYQASSFNQDLGNWDVSGVSVFNVLFTQSGFNNGGSNSINYWDMSSAASLLFMFAYCPFNQPLNLWDTSNVTTMKSMFEYNTVFNQNIQSWDVSSVDNFEQMFFGATAFNQNVSTWNTSSATNMRLMFRDNQSNVDVTNWNVTGVTTFEAMFMGNGSFNRSLNNWNVGLTNNYWSQLLFNCSGYNQPITGWTLNNSVNGMNDMLTNSSISVENYSRTLIAFANDVYNDGGLPSAVTFGASAQYNCTDYVVGQQYTNAVAARAYLVGLGWTITDGGQSGACASPTPTPTQTPSVTPTRTVTPTPTLTPSPSTACTPWTPSYLTTALWLDSSDAGTITLSGSLVTQWDDKSGNARNATTTSGNEPSLLSADLDGKNTIDFPSKWFDLPDFTLGYNATVFMLGRRDTTGSYQTALSLWSPSNSCSFGEMWGSGGAPTDYMYYGIPNEEVRGNTTLTNGTYYFTSILRTDTGGGTGSVSLFLDGATDNTPTTIVLPSSGTFNDSFIGKDQYNDYFDGAIAEIIVVDSALSTSDRQLVEGYLAWKWGMETTLPVSHPYRYSAPCAPAPSPTPTPTSSATPSVTPSLTPTSSVTPTLTPSPTPTPTPSPSSPSFTLQYDYGFVGSSGGITKVFDIMTASMSLPGCTINLTPFTSSSSGGGATQVSQTLTSACLNPSGYLNVTRRIYKSSGAILTRTSSTIVTRVNGVIVDTYTISTSTVIPTGTYLGEEYQPPITPTNGDIVSVVWTDTLI